MLILDCRVQTVEAEISARIFQLRIQGMFQKKTCLILLYIKNAYNTYIFEDPPPSLLHGRNEMSNTRFGIIPPSLLSQATRFFQSKLLQINHEQFVLGLLSANDLMQIKLN